jgi:hypothetical protein
MEKNGLGAENLAKKNLKTSQRRKEQTLHMQWDKINFSKEPGKVPEFGEKNRPKRQ